MKHNLPNRTYKRANDYKWKKGNKTPRIKWLNEQIDKL